MTSFLNYIDIVSFAVDVDFSSIIFLKDKMIAFRVGIGMISRGEAGLIVAGVGVSTGVQSSDIHTTVIRT